MPLITFFVYIAVNWWASWYPGAEPGGGGYIAQRIFCAKDEKNSLLATLWFNIAHYALRPWPWVIVALVACVRYQHDPAFAADPESGYIRILMADLPAYLRGLMLAAFAAAYMSTIGTQLNWGASYLVNDVYKRFMVKDANDKHYVRISQAITMVLMILSAIVTFYMDSIASAWKLLMAIGAGTGLVFILRWFWWRISAWSEISAMVASFITAMVLQYGFRLDDNNPKEFAYIILITVGVTSVTWLLATFLTKPESDEKLISFYRRVRPNPRFWAPIAAKVPEVKSEKDGLFNLTNWFSGVAMIYCALFGIGKSLLGEPVLGLILIFAAGVFGFIIYRGMSNRGWSTFSN